MIPYPPFANRDDQNRSISNAECRRLKLFRRVTVTGGRTDVPVLIKLGTPFFDILRLAIRHSAVHSAPTARRRSRQRMAPAERRTSHEIPGRITIFKKMLASQAANRTIRA